jgi:hypothetical protein
MIVEQAVTNQVVDMGLLTQSAEPARAILDVDKIDVVADRGYFKIEDIEACEKAGLTPHVPKPQRGSSVQRGSAHYTAKDSCVASIGRGQSGGGLVVEHPGEQRRETGRGLDVGGHGRGRSVGYGRERAAQTAGVLGLVLGIEPGEHRAGALVDEVDETEIPAGVAHFEPRQSRANG